MGKVHFLDGSQCLKSAWHVFLKKRPFYEVSWQFDYDNQNRGEILHRMVCRMPRDLNSRTVSLRILYFCRDRSESSAGSVMLSYGVIWIHVDHNFLTYRVVAGTGFVLMPLSVVSSESGMCRIPIQVA